MDETNEDPRFWIDDFDSTEWENWYAVCDEEAGGYIATFGELSDAKEFIEYKLAKAES